MFKFKMFYKQKSLSVFQVDLPPANYTIISKLVTNAQWIIVTTSCLRGEEAVFLCNFFFFKSAVNLKMFPNVGNNQIISSFPQQAAQ